MAISLPSKKFLLTTVAAVALVGIGAAGATLAQNYPHHRWHSGGWHAGSASPMMGQMMGMTRDADTDGDGRISQAEATALAATRAKEIDANKDGKIAAAEIEAYREKRRQDRMAEWLKSIDADGDGSVSVAEFEKAQIWRMARMGRHGAGGYGHPMMGQDMRGQGMEPGGGPRDGQGPRGPMMGPR